MSADEAARLVLGNCAPYDPAATVTLDRDHGVLTLRTIEFSIIATALSHADFWVCAVSSRNVSQGQRVTLYEGRHDVRDNRKICVT